MRNHRQAFSLLEIMLVVAIIGLMATTIIPRLSRRPPSSEWPLVLDNMNNLVFFARQEAISHQKKYRLRFKQVGKKELFVMVEEEKPDPENVSKKIFDQTDSSYFSTKVKLSEFIRIENVFHGKHDEFNENNSEAFCYVVPNGLVQDTVIRLTRHYDGKEDKVSFRMKPFLGKFELLQGHIKAEQ